MVWCGISWQGKTKLHFVPQGVKVKAKNYLEDVLELVVKPLNTSLFDGKSWTFQQDSVPSHKAKVVQGWLRQNGPDFISTEEWPAASSDLNPLDYNIWSKLELKVCSKPHTNLKNLKRAVVREWKKFPMDTIRASIEEWPARLRACVKARGGHFEHYM